VVAIVGLRRSEYGTAVTDRQITAYDISKIVVEHKIRDIAYKAKRIVQLSILT
jgi:hypothetical protein